MNGRNAFTAAMPLLILMLGQVTLPQDPGDLARTRRLAVTATSHLDRVDLLTQDDLALLDQHNPFGVPTTERPGSWTLIVREGYTLAHNNIDLIADWVSFRLTREFVRGTEPRPSSSAFKPDPLLPVGRRAELSDYKGWKGVFDRGHQAASEDQNGRGRTVIRESFLLSNMTPQASRLNSVRWRVLEGRIQDLAEERGELWVITGPLFVDEDRDGVVEHLLLGVNQVSVPTDYFKIVVARAEEGSDELEVLAFRFPNRGVPDDVGEFLVSIDEIEELSGFDFLPDMEDGLEDALEEQIGDPQTCPVCRPG